jgi:hypothetical protein
VFPFYPGGWPRIAGSAISIGVSFQILFLCLETCGSGVFIRFPWILFFEYCQGRNRHLSQQWQRYTRNAMGFRHLGIDASFLGLVTVGSF